MDKNEGGYAFPKAGLDPWGQAKVVHAGMTLRDYFAARAMQSMLSTGDYDVTCKSTLSEDAYAVADAMLAAREAK